ncbi:kelch-like protein 10 [Lutzomyia longipalpis]|uniref:kelch-like protein 10 n=1 Tax=Lutzomyia longipalpis TaxID=7200 RepID=UPI002483FC67|nr:kelch-like protein 10 [Lutzomyia longipalpis]
MSQIVEFSKFRNENIFNDASLRLSDGTLLPVHRVILCLKSNYFLSLFTNPLKHNGKGSNEFFIPGIRREIMEKILQFIYTEMLEFEYDEIFELLTVADYFLIDGLTEQCRDFLKNTLNPKNCVKIFLFAEARFHRDVMEAARKFILVNFLKVMNVCEDFTKLDYEHFNQIISSDLLNVKDELSVWNACLNWINNSPDERKKLIYQLVQLVRMCLMNAEDFQTSIERHPYVLECTKAKSLIDLVKKFHLKSELSQEIFEYKLALPRLPHEVIVTLGGWSEGSAKMEIETYDTRADRWILIGCEDPFGPRAYHGSIAIGEKIYCIGGFNGSEYFNNCRIFDTVTRTWHPMAPMNVRRCYVSVALLNGNIYAMGGFDGSVRHRTCEMYDLKTNLWTFVAQMNSQRSDACATVMDGRIYILGGFNGHECMNTAEVYDAELNAWSLIPQMIHRRSGLKCIAHHGRIYAIGGFNGLVRLKHCEQFNPTTDTWSPIAEMLCPRSNFAIEVIDDMIFVMAGYNGTFTISDVECYVHETDEWMMVTSMNIVRSALSANVIRNTRNIQDYLYPWRAELIEERHQTSIHATDSETENLSVQ